MNDVNDAYKAGSSWQRQWLALRLGYSLFGGSLLLVALYYARQDFSNFKFPMMLDCLTGELCRASAQRWYRLGVSWGLIVIGLGGSLVVLIHLLWKAAGRTHAAVLRQKRQEWTLHLVYLLIGGIVLLESYRHILFFGEYQQVGCFGNPGLCSTHINRGLRLALAGGGAYGVAFACAEGSRGNVWPWGTAPKMVAGPPPCIYLPGMANLAHGRPLPAGY